MGYFCAEVVAAAGRLLRQPARPTLGSIRASPRPLFRRAVPALALVGSGRARALGAVGARDGPLGHCRQGRRAPRPRAAGRAGPRSAAAVRARAARVVAGRTRPSTRPSATTSLGFRGLKIGTGFEGRPGGYTTAPGTPPVRHVVRGEHGRASRGRAGEVRCAPRGARPRTSSSRRTATRSRSASRGRARRHSTSPARSSRSISCSWRNRSDTTTRTGYAELRRATRVPIAGGECLTGRRRVRPLPGLDGALDYVQPDATHVGGIAASRARSRGWPRAGTSG